VLSRWIGEQHFDGKGHFFAAAAEAMRRVLVNHARDRSRLKRGDGRNRVDLDRLTSPAASADGDLLDLDDALDRLATEFPVAAELVKLRFFTQCSAGESRCCSPPMTEPVGSWNATPPGFPKQPHPKLWKRPLFPFRDGRSGMIASSLLTRCSASRRPYLPDRRLVSPERL